MSSKVTWEDILVDFKQRHPSLAKNVIDFRPHGFGTIRVWFKDGTTMIYDHTTKRGLWDKNWK